MTDTSAKPLPAESKVAIPEPATTKAKTVPSAVKRKAAAPVSAAAKKLTKSADKAIPSKPTAVKKTVLVAKAVATVKPSKVKKVKMVRDSMTMPKAEYAVLDTLKLRAVKLGHPIKKTELLRAGIKALNAMSDTGFMVALKAVPSLKTGRPSKS